MTSSQRQGKFSNPWLKILIRTSTIVIRMGWTISVNKLKSELVNTRGNTITTILFISQKTQWMQCQKPRIWLRTTEWSPSKRSDNLKHYTLIEKFYWHRICTCSTNVSWTLFQRKESTRSQTENISTTRMVYPLITSCWRSSSERATCIRMQWYQRSTQRWVHSTPTCYQSMGISRSSIPTWKALSNI